MKIPKRLTTAIFVLLLQCNSTLSSGSHEEEGNSEGRRKRRPAGEGEAEDDAEFAAAVLGLVHDKVRDAGNVFRVVGDTAGGLAGGSIKAVGAAVHGLSSVLDAASRTMEPKPGVLIDKSSPLSWSGDELTEPTDRVKPWTRNDHAEGQDFKTPPADAQGQDVRSSIGGGSSSNPNPVDRIASVVRTSLAGSLKLVSAATRGAGDAVFQAGTVVEEITGGTGEVAEDVFRVVQGAVGWVRDDMLRFSDRNDPIQEGQADINPGKGPPSQPGAQAVPSSESTFSGQNEDTKATSAKAKVAAIVVSATAVGALTVWNIYKRTGMFAYVALHAALRELVALFRRKNGALPPAPRLAVVIMLVLVIWRRRRRHYRNHRSQQQQHEQQLSLQPVETTTSTTPRRSHDVVGQEPPPAGAVPAAAGEAGTSASSAGLTSPSRSLSTHGPRSSVPSPLPVSAGLLPSFGGYPGVLNGLDPLLPSPAQARASNARLGLIRASSRVGLAARAIHEESGIKEEAVCRRWDWRWFFGWARFSRIRKFGVGRRRWVWLVLVWFSASVLEERERDRVAWLAWDEGFRAGEKFCVGDSGAADESVAWLNHLIGGVWGGHLTGPHARQTSVSGTRSSSANRFVFEGLRSFVSEQLAANIAEALEEFNSKSTNVVRVELQEVDLGSSSPQILGVKVLDPVASAAPGWGDGRCGTLGGDCVALRIDLEVATRGLRVGVVVKPSTRGDKALLPTGTVRLLELYLRGSLSVRVELRKEFPFVGMALVAFDGEPDVQVRMEQWGLDALTLGAVDEWARVGLQGALKPFLLPGYLEVDAAHALCPDCPTSTPVEGSARQVAQEDETRDALNALSARPSLRPSATVAPNYSLISRPGTRRTGSSSKPLDGDTAVDGLRWQTVARKRDDARGRSGGERDPPSSANDRDVDGRDLRRTTGSSYSPSSSTASEAAVPGLHKRNWMLGRALKRFKDWLLSGSVAEGMRRLGPMDLEGLE